MSFEIKQATRGGIKVLCGMYGRSGSGKTLSALYLARGVAGPTGTITLIDSESGRGSIFADMIPGGYKVIEIEPPFSPERYLEAFELAERDSAVVVIDSLSHEHNGEGGVLDMQEAELDRMAGDNWQKREACKMAAWIKPKMSHKRFIQRILRSKCALVCCLRGEEKTRVLKEGGKSKVITDEFSSPIFDQRFIFELLVNFETVSRDGVGGFVIPRKITHPAIADLLPRENEQLSIKHGEAIARWCNSPITGPQAPADSEIKALKKRMNDRAVGHFKTGDGKLDVPALTEWLRKGNAIQPEETLSTLNVERLRAVVEMVEESLEAKF
jgi:hypothetical protein